MMMLLKHETVLEKGPDVDASGKRVIFTVEPEDESDVPGILYLARSLWEEFGQPDTITVTVEPGDSLNDPTPSFRPGGLADRLSGRKELDT